MKTPINYALSAVLFVLILIVWEAVVTLAKVPDFIVPPPSQIVMALYRGIDGGIYLHHLGITLTETLAGFALGSLLGLSIGIAIALNKYVEFFLYPYVVMFQSTPKVALAPLIVIWFGLGLTSKIISAVLVAFFPMMVNTITGLRSVDEEQLNLMTSLTASKTQVLLMLRLPMALPYIMAGLEIALTFSLLGTIVAEFIGANAGLGMLLTSMNYSMDIAGEFSILLLLSVVGLLLSTLIGTVRKSVLFWDATSRMNARKRSPKTKEKPTLASRELAP
jgi:NitT/TauT family transport system permease protein